MKIYSKANKNTILKIVYKMSITLIIILIIIYIFKYSRFDSFYVYGIITACLIFLGVFFLGFKKDNIIIEDEYIKIKFPYSFVFKKVIHYKNINNIGCVFSKNKIVSISFILKNNKTFIIVDEYEKPLIEIFDIIKRRVEIYKK